MKKDITKFLPKKLYNYYFKKNVAGEQREWWYHAMGCRNWFIANRNTVTNTVASTFLYDN